MNEKYYIAIADIHGNADLLKRKLLDCDRWRVENNIPAADVQFVFLGDYIDRGTQHLEVLRLVKERVEEGAVALIGNHEDMMLGSVDGTVVNFADGRKEDNLLLWHANKGIETCRDMFGVKMVKRYAEGTEEVPTFAISDYVPDIKASWVYEFLKGLKRSYETEHIFFSHAPQSEKAITDDTLLWGNKRDYIDARGDLIFKVPKNKTMSVHGHIHMIDSGIFFPRIVNFMHGSMMRTVVLCDSGCGSWEYGELHPVVLRERTIKVGKNDVKDVGIVTIL
jgi:hypothetical protein